MPMQEPEQKQGACMQRSLSLLLAITAKKALVIYCSRWRGHSPLRWVSLFWSCKWSHGTPHLSLTATNIFSKPAESWSAHKIVKDRQELLGAIIFIRKRIHLPCWMCRIPMDVGRRWEDAMPHCKGAKLSSSQTAHGIAVCLPAFAVCPANVCGLKNNKSEIKVFDVGTYNCVWENVFC